MAKSLSDSWPQCLTLQQTLMILACGDGLMEFHSVERSLLRKKQQQIVSRLSPPQNFL